MKRRFAALFSTALAGSLASCAWLPKPAPGPAVPPAVAVSTAPAKVPDLRLLSESELPDFSDGFEAKGGLAAAARKTLAYLETVKSPRYFRIGERDYGAAVLADTIQEFLKVLEAAPRPEDLKAAIREKFDVYQSVGQDGAGKVVFSSYYQPLIEASPKKTAKYRHPLYKRPPDMVSADLSRFGRNPAGDPLIGRVDKDGSLVPYFSRGEIDIRKALAGRKMEVAWLKDKFEALDLHIQGSGILRYPDGREVLAKYAATNGRPYNSVGLLLVKAGIFSKEDITREKVRDYLREHPDAEGWILSQNPRYTFFDIAPLPQDGEPFGSIQQSLTPSRSIAIDPAVIPLGALAFFTTVSPQADKTGRLLGQFQNSRFALCMDTGGAIKGPGRVDIYVGHGPQAETTAFNQWNEGKLYILVKKIPARER